MRLLTTAAAIAASLLLSACISTSVETQESFELALPASGNALAFDIETRNGSVTVLEDPSVTAMQFTASYRTKGRTLELAEDRLAGFKTEVVRRADGTLEVRPDTPGGWENGDAVSLRVVVPDLGEVTVSTSNGKIVTEGAAGACSLRTSNGSVTTKHTSGPLVIDTSNGAISMTGHGGTVQADSSNGSITLKLNSGPSPVFDLETSNGSIRVEIGSDWKGEVQAKTSNGRVTHSQGGKAIASGKRALSISLGSGTPVSSLVSSNGSIKVDVRQGDSSY